MNSLNTNQPPDLAWLLTGPAEQYFTAYPIRLITLRVLLEGLGICLPEYARRKVGGRPPHRAAKGCDVAAAFDRDNPSYRAHALAPRKPNATQDRIAQLEAETNPSLRDRIAALKATQAPQSAASADDIDPLAFLSLD